MDEVGVDVGRIEIGATAHGTENRLQWFGTGEACSIQLKAADGQISFLPILVAETADLDRHQLRQLARKIIDVDPGAAVNVRRIFVREEERLHSDSLTAPTVKRTQIPQ
jgi:hypothetical protein